MKKILFKFNRSISKLIFPFLAKLFISMRVNRRAINYLSLKSFEANNSYDFRKIIENLLQKKKLIAIDIGAQGGFNSDNFFLKKYEDCFQVVAVEPLKDEAEKLKEEHKYVIDKALWSSETKKKIFFLGKRPGSSSMFMPEKSNFDIHNIKQKDYSLFDITKTLDVETDTLSNSLNKIGINSLDYIKLDTQGSELEILKGINDFRPLIVRIEIQIFSMYKDTPKWTKVVDYLNDLGYLICDWRGIGSHSTRVPGEMDMIFIPDFKSKKGIELINNNEKKFISLMLIFGQIKLLNIISNKNDFKFSNFLKDFDDRYFF